MVYADILQCFFSAGILCRYWYIFLCYLCYTTGPGQEAAECGENSGTSPQKEGILTTYSCTPEKAITILLFFKVNKLRKDSFFNTFKWLLHWVKLII